MSSLASNRLWAVSTSAASSSSDLRPALSRISRARGPRPSSSPAKRSRRPPVATIESRNWETLGPLSPTSDSMLLAAPSTEPSALSAFSRTRPRSSRTEARTSRPSAVSAAAPRPASSNCASTLPSRSSMRATAARTSRTVPTASSLRPAVSKASTFSVRLWSRLRASPSTPTPSVASLSMPMAARRISVSAPSSCAVTLSSPAPSTAKIGLVWVDSGDRFSSAVPGTRCRLRTPAMFVSMSPLVPTGTRRPGSVRITART